MTKALQPPPDVLLALARSAALETAAAGVAAFDTSGRCLFANARLAELLGRKLEEVVGANALDLVEGEWRELVRAALSQCAGVPTAAEELEVSLARADGDRVWVTMVLSPLLDEGGAYVGILGFLRDISEHRRAALALLTLADVGTLLARPFDEAVTPGALARALVPRMADACTIHIRDGAALHRTAHAGDEHLAKARAFVPLVGLRDVLGVLTLAKRVGGFDQRDRRLACEIASHVATAMDRDRAQREVEAQRETLRIIAEVSRALSEPLDVEGVARAIAHAAGGSVFVGFIECGGAVAVTTGASVDPDVEARMRTLIGHRSVPLDGTAGHQVLRTLKPVLLVGDEILSRTQPAFREVLSRGIRSLIVAPLHVQGRIIGLMGAFRAASSKAFVDDDRRLVAEIAGRAAMAFERAELFERQQRAIRRQRLLADAGMPLAQALEVEPSLLTFARLSVQWFADTCAAELFEQGRISNQVFAGCTPALEEAVRRTMTPYLGTEVALKAKATRDILATGHPALWRNLDEGELGSLATDDEQRTQLRHLGLRTLIFVPLVARGAVFGWLGLGRARGALFDDDDLELAAEFGGRAALAVDNARLFRRANEAVAVRDEFLSIAGHELNTPLTPLKMQLDSLRRRAFEPERAAEKLQAASRQVTRLAKLATELLDVSRISGGRLELDPEPLDLGELVEEIAARMGDEAERAGCPIALRIERPCAGEWDRMRVDQVVTNLLSNAIKYGDHKPIEIEVTKAPGAHGARAVVAVRDHGIGIAPEHQQRVFERFERAASVRHYGGFGLGLWIARQIVEVSGGTISVDSKLGMGSTFVVDLPCHRGD